LPGRGVALVGSVAYLVGNPKRKRLETATAHTAVRLAIIKQHLQNEKLDGYLIEMRRQKKYIAILISYLILIFISRDLSGQEILVGQYCQGKCGSVVTSWIDFKENNKFELWLDNPRTKDYDLSIGYGFYKIFNNELHLNFVDYSSDTSVTINRIGSSNNDTVINIVFLDNMIHDTIDGTYFVKNPETNKELSRGFTNDLIRFSKDLLPIKIVVQMIPFNSASFKITETGCYKIQILTDLVVDNHLDSENNMILKIKKRTQDKLILYNPKLKMRLRYFKK